MGGTGTPPDNPEPKGPKMAGMNFSGSVAAEAHIYMMEAKMAAGAAAYYVEDITGVRMPRVDETLYGQEVYLMRDALMGLRTIRPADRCERANAALRALVWWEVARDAARRAKATGLRREMVRAWEARVVVVDAMRSLS